MIKDKHKEVESPIEVGQIVWHLSILRSGSSWDIYRAEITKVVLSLEHAGLAWAGELSYDMKSRRGNSPDTLRAGEAHLFFDTKEEADLYGCQNRLYTGGSPKTGDGSL